MRQKGTKIEVKIPPQRNSCLFSHGDTCLYVVLNPYLDVVFPSCLNPSAYGTSHHYEVPNPPENSWFHLTSYAKESSTSHPAVYDLGFFRDRPFSTAGKSHGLSGLCTYYGPIPVIRPKWTDPRNSALHRQLEHVFRKLPKHDKNSR